LVSEGGEDTEETVRRRGVEWWGEEKEMDRRKWGNPKRKEWWGWNWRV